MRSPPHVCVIVSRSQHTTVVCWGGGLNKYQVPGADCLQPTLRSGFQRQVKRSVRCQRHYEDRSLQCTVLLSRASIASLCMSDCWGNCKEHVASIESRGELTRRYSRGHSRRGLHPICYSFRTPAMVGGAVAQPLGPGDIIGAALSRARRSPTISTCCW